MTYRKPFLQVLGPNGGDLVQLGGSSLIGVKIVDRADFEADEATLMFTRKPPFVSPPPQGTPYTVRAGWSKTDVAITGVYTFQRVGIKGRPEGGQELHLICRAGDLTDQLRGVGSQHFDEKNGHKTLGDVFRTLFKDSGKAVELSADLEKMPVPGGYALRWNQSPLDFATELSQEIGAVFKPAGDKIIVTKHGSGQSVSGQTLPTILIKHFDGYDFDVDLEPRWSFASLSSSYFDPAKGLSESEAKQGGGGHAQGGLPHPFNSKEQAAAAAAAAFGEYGRFSGNGVFVQPGMPEAVAQAPAKCSDFGVPIDDVDWELTGVTHDIIPDSGWLTTLETEVKMT